MAFTLPPLVGFCRVADRAVFLDARADHYWLLGHEHARVVERAIEGAPLDELETKIIQTLALAGLVANNGKPAVPAVVPAPVDTSLLDDIRPAPVATAVAGLDFIRAVRRLRKQGLESSLRRLWHVRAASFQATGGASDNPIAGAAGLRLLVSATGRCLPLSLALATRCRSEDVRLVFGVKLDPFAAHAWVQRGSTVLNDEVHVVRQFTPVLAI